jgi:hypothetical protein
MESLFQKMVRLLLMCRVELKASHKSVFSDNNGDFIFQNLPSLTDSLIISSVQYERYAFAVDVC